MLARTLARELTHLPLLSFALGSLLLLASCGGSRLAIEYDYDDEADFAALRTWSWIATDESGTGSAKVDAIVREALKSQLGKLDYQYVASGGDFRAGFVLETQRKITQRYIDTRFGYGSSNYHFDFVRGREMVVEDYLRGTLILDVTSADGEHPIWRGWAEGVIREGMRDDQIRAEVTEAIRRVLEKFPPPATRKK